MSYIKSKHHGDKSTAKKVTTAYGRLRRPLPDDLQGLCQQYTSVLARANKEYSRGGD